MFKYIHMIAGGLLVLPIALSVGFIAGIKHEKDVIAARTAAGRITILEDGRKVDDRVLRADDSGLCDLLGGC